MKKTILLLAIMLVCLCSNAVEVGKWYAIGMGGKALIIQNASMQNGAPLVLWSPTNVPSQLWQLCDNGDGTYSFTCGYLEEALCTATSARAGTKITARTQTSIKRLGRWNLTPVEGKTNTFTFTTADGAYMMSATEAADNIQPTVVDASNPTGLTEWTLTEYSGEVQTSYNATVRDDILADFMTQYYHTSSSGHVLGGGGFWGDAEMFETLLDGYETTGKAVYKTYWLQLRKDFVNRTGNDWCSTGQGWPRSNEYNDDITWIVLACVRAYKYFGQSDDLTLAKSNFDKMYARALQPGGTLRWKERDSGTTYGSNSCINCPAINAACYLYEATGDEGYLDKAKALWEVQYKYLCDQNDGHVWDSGSWDSGYTKFTVGNFWGSTYNQGTMLGACVNLYRITGVQKYKDYADKVWNWSYNNLCASNNNQPKILSACQTAVGDLCGFKGILVRYARLYGEEFDKEEVMLWLEKNAWFAYQNANNKGVIWSKWLTKTPDNFKSQEGDATKDFSNDPFGASTAVSCALNAHVNRQFHKDAYTEIHAGMLDDLKTMQLSTANNDGDTPNTANSKDGFICFKNVVFGTEPALKADLRLYAASDASTGYKLYLDKISDETLIGTTPALTKGWNNYEIDITPTTGQHKLFVAIDDCNYATKFHYVVFMGEPAPAVVPGDANNDGSVTMSDANLVVSYFVTEGAVEINHEAADMNADDAINMADANAIVNIFTTQQ